jgi:prephenate dehydrogenase
MARKRKSAGRRIDCKDAIYGHTFWDLALGPGGDDSRFDELHKIWQACGAEIVEINPDEVDKIWAFRKWGYPK